MPSKRVLPRRGACKPAPTLGCTSMTRWPLADPNYPRRHRLVVPGVIELVAHPNYLVFLDEGDTTVTALSVVHVKRKHPN